MAADPREPYGRMVHDVRLAHEAVRAAAEGRVTFRLGDWEDRAGHQRELDMAIGAAVAAAERERIAALMDELAAYYPESVWPPDSDVRDSIGATAMRHAYRNAARSIREPQERSDEKEASDG